MRDMSVVLPHRRILTIVLITVLTACGGESGSGVAPSHPTAKAAAVTITVGSDTVAGGDSTRARATVTATSGAVIADPLLHWQSSDTTIAGVDSAGLIQTRKIGSFTLSVSAVARGTTDAVSATRTMFSKRTVASVAVVAVAGSDTITLGDSLRLSVIARDGFGEAYPGVLLSWSVTDTSVASVDASGLVSARAMGSDTIIATVVGPAGALGAPVSGRAAVTTRLAFTRIAAGSMHTCGIARGGSMYCWGEGWFGRLGDGVQRSTYVSVSQPVRVLSSAEFTSLSLDENYDSRSGHTCATTRDESLMCWGSGAWGMLGDGHAGQDTPPHLSVIPLRVGSGTFVDVALGGKHSCALSASGDVYCAGSNTRKELGVSAAPDVCVEPGAPPGYDTSCAITFIKVTQGVSFAHIASSAEGACALTSTGETWCWGVDYTGNGSLPEQIDSPQFVSLAGGDEAMCGITPGGAAYCWGTGGYGALGTGTETSWPFPLAVSTPLTFTQLSGGRDYACGITPSGDTYCWGRNDKGQLGTVTSETCMANSSTAVPCSTQPVQVQSVPKFVGIAAGGSHTCGLVENGSVYCWGANDHGELGNSSVGAFTISAVRVSDTR